MSYPLSFNHKSQTIKVSIYPQGSNSIMPILGNQLYQTDPGISFQHQKAMLSNKASHSISNY